ncbi:hypothetical protein Tco_1546708 [Tanacetum coccineum]
MVCVAAAEVRQQGGDKATLEAKERVRGACKVFKNVYIASAKRGDATSDVFKSKDIVKEVEASLKTPYRQPGMDISLVCRRMTPRFLGESEVLDNSVLNLLLP